MSNSKKTINPTPWEDFDAHLTEESVSVVPHEEEAAIEDALELQMISIRLQKSLISNLKLIADFHKIGYQPLIRDLLNRFVRSEIPIIINTVIEQKRALLERIEQEVKADDAGSRIVDDFLTRESARKVA
jgi:predicted DNA binding CopG/RHH family protein